MLARHYSWMFGDYGQQVAAQQKLFDDLKLRPRSGKRALDLGCGSGFQSSALARMGPGDVASFSLEYDDFVPDAGDFAVACDFRDENGAPIALGCGLDVEL